MGASFVVRMHEGSEESMRKWVDNCINQDRIEHGSSYSGYWNMTNGLSVDRHKVFESTEAAEEYLHETCDKSGPLIAVRAKVIPTLSYQEALKDKGYAELHQQAADKKRLLWSFDGQLLKRAKEGKSAFRACSTCKSKISVQHLRGVACPVCNSNLLCTASDDKKKEALKAAIERLEAKAKKRAEMLLKKKSPDAAAPLEVWVVAGICAS